VVSVASVLVAAASVCEIEGIYHAYILLGSLHHIPAMMGRCWEKVLSGCQNVIWHIFQTVTANLRLSVVRECAKNDFRIPVHDDLGKA
jgi:hypothetical protein